MPRSIVSSAHSRKGSELTSSAELNGKQDAYLAAIRQAGDSELARGYAGISKEELAQIPQERIVEARTAFDKARIDDAIKLRRRARDFAMLTEDVKAMLMVADYLAPELGVYQGERARARARPACYSTATQRGNGGVRRTPARSFAEAERIMVTLPLTQEQITLLKPIVTEKPKKPVLFVATAAPHGNGDWRLQVERLEWKQANRVLKIINTPASS
jgi:hypothetical protein